MGSVVEKKPRLPGLELLESLPLWSGDKNFSLETPRKLLELLDNPQNKVRSVHVAGTNGKGSVCTYISAMLLSAGYSVGQFASPYLSYVNERTIINGKPCDPKILSESVLYVWNIAEKARLRPSLFELLTAVSFLEFARRELDWMVIEVGLGGRLDATNTILKSEVGVITSIDYDHTHILGDTLSKIAAEKAMIGRDSVPLIVGKLGEEARKSIEAISGETGAELSFYGESFSLDCESGEAVVAERRIPLPFHPPVSQFQLENACVAARVATELGIEPGNISDGLSRANWPGRLERLEVEGRPFILDVAHNPAGITAFTKWLGDYLDLGSFPRVQMVLSFLETKDWKKNLEILQAFESTRPEKIEFVFTKASHPSACDPESLQEFFGKGRVAENPLDAVRCRHEDSTEPLTVVTGSIFLVGEVRPKLTDTSFSTFRA